MNMSWPEELSSVLPLGGIVQYSLIQASCPLFRIQLLQITRLVCGYTCIKCTTLKNLDVNFALTSHQDLTTMKEAWLWNYSHCFSSDDCGMWSRKPKGGAWPRSMSSRSPHKNMGHLSNDHTVCTCLTVLISTMLPFDQRPFQSLGLESMRTTAASHTVEAVSKHGIVHSHPGSNQGPCLSNQHTHLIERYIWAESRRIDKPKY